jgi:hypothetical protein
MTNGTVCILTNGGSRYEAICSRYNHHLCGCASWRFPNQQPIPGFAGGFGPISDLVIGNESDYGYVVRAILLMKFSLSLALFTAFFVASCAEEPPQRPPQRVATYSPAQTQEYPPPQQPFNPNGPVQPPATSQLQTAPSPPPTAAPTKVAKGDYPYGIPVPGKPHLVESPYSPGKYVDVEGFPPGTEVKDPYTDKIFLVP